MKTKKITQFSKLSLLALVLVFVSNIAISQTDTTNVATQDTTKVANTEKADGQKSGESNKEKKDEKKKKIGVFMAYASVTFNQLNTSSTYESYIATGLVSGCGLQARKVFLLAGGRPLQQCCL